MRFILLIMITVFSNSIFSQIDSSDVFIITDDSFVNSEDKEFEKEGIQSILKYEIARLSFGEIIFSYEYIFKNNKFTIEPEVEFTWLGQGAYFFDYYTNHIGKKVYSSHSNVNLGGGLALKKYFQSEGAPYGFYSSVKIKERVSKVLIRSGFFNLIDLSLNLGYSKIIRNWFQLDFLIGGGVTHSYFKYTDHHITNGVYVWTPKSTSLILPSINFGFRIGATPSFVISKLNQYW